nr:PREDICTED: olfactory receptor 2AP1-like [Lepisosteus oculatus]
MGGTNVTLLSEFIMLGLPGLQEHNTALFTFFLILILATLLGNLLIVVLISLDHRLHTPMYFFLWNLAVLDVLITVTVIPKLLAVLSGHDKTISFFGCFAQMYFFISFAAVEAYLVAVMAYDRYVAIVKPLHYNNVMSMRVCITMMASIWVLGFLAPLTSVILASTSSYCGSNHILHIVCDYPTVMSLACGDVTAQVNLALCLAMAGIYIPVLFVLWSYYRIICSVIKMKTLQSRKKAFSMCSSHVIVVFLYYMSSAVVYIGMRVEAPTEMLAAPVPLEQALPWEGGDGQCGDAGAATTAGHLPQLWVEGAHRPGVLGTGAPGTPEAVRKRERGGLNGPLSDTTLAPESQKECFPLPAALVDTSLTITCGGGRCPPAARSLLGGLRLTMHRLENRPTE